MKPIIRERIVRNLVQKPGKELDTLLRRVTCQLEFARAFAKALANDDWLTTVDAAVGELDRFSGDFAELGSLVSRIESSLAPIGTAAKVYVIHCVGHGHIDMNWMWSWPETAATTYDTFASVLSFMEKYPELTYSQSQTSVYALVEQYYPEMFEQIRQRVAEGRWEVTAAHWVEGDKNLASGEALAHHLLYTRKYFQDKFGLSPEDVPVDWEPDTFGHANTIPNILRQGAVKYYYSCRTGGGHEHERVGDARPPIFWWEGTDGSRVLVNRETTWYNSYVNIGDNYALPMVEFVKQTGLTDWLNVFGLGNHGGGPTRDEIDFFIETQGWPIWPTVRFSTSKAYFEKIEADISARGLSIPVLKQELNFEFTGCYTSQSAIKRANRFGENFCVEAEGLAVLGSLDGRRIEPAWRNVLFNQFHDILPGSGVAATREHALGLFQEVGAITGAIKRVATRELAQRIDTASLVPDTPEGREEFAQIEAGRANKPFEAGAGQCAGVTGLSVASGGGQRFRPVVVYNPCAWERTEVVQVRLYDLPFDADRLVALDEPGVSHPVVAIQKNGWDWGHERNTVLFVASDVPALGYKTYLFCEGSADAKDPRARTSDNDRFETPYLTGQFDRYESGLTELVDKRTDLELTNGIEGLGHWEYLVERPRGMTAWVLGGVDPESVRPLKATSFRMRGGVRNEGTGEATGGSPIVIGTWTLEVPGTKSTVELNAIVQSHRPRVEFVAEIDWREIGDSEVGIPGLRIDFENSVDTTSARFETPYGTIERPEQPDLDVPSLRYASVVGDESGFTLLQDSKYGHENGNGALSLRVVRSTFDPDHAPEVGKSTLRYAVVLHDSTPSAADLTRLGAEQNHPLIVFPATLQRGDLPAAKSYAKVFTPDVVLAGLKPGESGGVVLRLVNYSEDAIEAEVELDGVFTGAAQVVDLMERPTAGTASFDGSILKATIGANSFVSVRIG